MKDSRTSHTSESTVIAPACPAEAADSGPRGQGFQSMLGVDGVAERAIRQIVARLDSDPEERKKWIRKETLTHAAILAYRARNAADLGEARSAAEGFQKVIAPMIQEIKKR